MGNCIDWAALPVVAEMFGIDNIEAFLARLLAVRDHVRALAQHGH